MDRAIEEGANKQTVGNLANAGKTSWMSPDEPQLVLAHRCITFSFTAIGGCRILSQGL